MTTVSSSSSSVALGAPALFAETTALLSTVKYLLSEFEGISTTGLSANDLVNILDGIVNGKYQAVQTATQQLGQLLTQVEGVLTQASQDLALLKKETGTEFSSFKAKVELYIARFENMSKQALGHSL